MFVRIFFCALYISYTFQWDLESENIVFGEDVMLTCNSIKCSSKSIKTWIGGPQYKVLCFKGFSVDSSKYEMMIKDNNPKFSLKIKNLTIEDFNCKYTCSCGLQQYTEMLDLNALQYIYPPKIDENNNQRTRNKYLVDIVIKVYPLPTCFIAYEMDVILVNVTSFPNTLPMLNDSSSREYILYKLRIQHTFWKKKSLDCGENLHLFCATGAVNYTVWRANITMCKDNSDTDDETLEKGNSMIIIVLIVTVLIALVFVLLATYLVSKYKIYMCRRSTETEHPISDDAINYHQVEANSEDNRESCPTIDY